VHLEGPAPTVRAPRGRTTVNAVALDPGAPLEITVTVPPAGRLDLALGAPGGAARFRILRDGELALDEAVTDWTQAHLDLSAHAGQPVALRFEVTPEGEVDTYLGAPTLSGAPPDAPNVLLYVIDGGGADLMSLYGYHRSTTPHLEALAAQSVVFDRARVNAAWTKPSTASFMTSLHHSVLGGFTQNEDDIPAAAVTMAEHFHAAGYQTAVFTSNPFAGSMSGLQASVDVFRDHGAQLNATSSAELHAEFWRWRRDWPGGPWWAHIQTTDVHEPFQPVEPFAGTWASPERQARFDDWTAQLKGVSIQRDTVLEQYQARLRHLGVEPRDFFRTQWDLYDESMRHNDATLGALVAELKAAGEWERTLLIVTADHGHPAGSFSRFGRGMVEPTPPPWEGALADSWRTWVPLVVSWPGHLPGGVRIDQPVSLLDLLPTVLELAGLPAASVQQGRSLVPLLTGAGALEPRPIVIEQVQAWPETGEMVGHIEIIDGDEAASLEVMPAAARAAMAAAGSLTTNGGWRAARPHRASTPALLLYDLAADPHALSNTNQGQAVRVAESTARLAGIWAEHQALAEVLGGAQPGAAGADQIDALRVLGYVE
jgi:arylsulfatase A-like enzyme